MTILVAHIDGTPPRQAEAERQKQRQEDERRRSQQQATAAPFTASPIRLPHLEKVDITKYSSERERLYAETDVNEATQRLNTIEFNFKFN